MLASFRERYTAVKRMALSSVNDAKSSPGGVGSSKTVCIEVQFIGPQPSQGPGALLCNLLSGTSVEARPIELRRGRDNKRKPQDSGYDEGSHSGEHFLCSVYRAYIVVRRSIPAGIYYTDVFRLLIVNCCCVYFQIPPPISSHSREKGRHFVGGTKTIILGWSFYDSFRPLGSHFTLHSMLYGAH